jgi:hypothetical protein
MEGGRLLVAVLVAAVAYWAACSFLALGWWWLVGIYGTRPSLRGGYAVFARSQLAKYLPGNAFHLVSRQVLGRQLGLGHAELVASSFLEVGTQLLAALVVAGTLYGLAGGPAADHLSELWPWVLVVSLMVLFAWPAIDTGLRRLPRVARWLEGLPRLSARDLILLLGPALFCYVLFFVATGGILLALVSLLEGPVSGDVLARTLGIYPLAWTAGTVTVGAPAGVGVREAVLMLELESWMPTLHASAAALAFRLVTLGGDLLTAMVGQLIKKA